MQIVVGSVAFRHWTGLPTQPNDIDIWVEEGKKCLVFTDLSYDISYIPKNILTLFQGESKESGYAALQDLLAIKLSHLPYDIFWHKHFQSMLSLWELTGSFYNSKLYEGLCSYWSKAHTKDKLRLFKTEDEFFDDFVIREYDHDWLHELVSHKGVPVYTKTLVDGQEVLVCKNKFDRLKFKSQVRMWQEEIAVIALERWVIPSKGEISYLQAWQRSLHKVVTSLTKGWASEWIIMNAHHFLTPLELGKGVWKTLGIKEIKMELKDIVELFNKELGKDLFFIGWESWGEDRGSEGEHDIVEFLVDGAGAEYEPDIEHIETKGGGEGGSEHVETVVKLKDTYYKLFYAYYSYDGYNFDYLECKEVKPVDRVVTFYE